MERIANSDARGYVASRKPFKGSNMFAKWEGDSIYVVYSYGTHFPMWVWDDTIRQWFGNHDKYSRSTTKQQGQSRPVMGGADAIRWFDTTSMKELVHRGLSGLAATRVITGRNYT